MKILGILAIIMIFLAYRDEMKKGKDRERPHFSDEVNKYLYGEENNDNEQR